MPANLMSNATSCGPTSRRWMVVLASGAVADVAAMAETVVVIFSVLYMRLYLWTARYVHVRIHAPSPDSGGGNRIRRTVRPVEHNERSTRPNSGSSCESG